MRSFSLSISNPCSENWDEMKPVNGGRHCSSCCKVVVDFTAMSTEAISSFIKQNAGRKICGNFYEDQLQSKFYVTYKVPFSFNNSFLKYSLAGLLFFAGAHIKAQSVSNGAPIVKDNSGKTTSTSGINSSKKRQLIIKVTDDLGIPLTGATVKVEFFSEEFLTDTGCLFIDIPASLQERQLKIVVTAKDFQPVTRLIDLKKDMNNTLQIELYAYRRMVKGEVMMVPESKRKCGNK